MRVPLLIVLTTQSGLILADWDFLIHSFAPHCESQQPYMTAQSLSIASASAILLSRLESLQLCEDAIYLKSFRKDMFLSESFFMTLATAISKSSCIRRMLLSTESSSGNTTSRPWHECEGIQGTHCEPPHLGDVYPSFPQRKHSSLCAACLQCRGGVTTGLDIGCPGLWDYTV